MSVIEQLERAEADVDAIWDGNKQPSSKVLNARYLAWMGHTKEILAVLRAAVAWGQAMDDKAERANDLMFYVNWLRSSE